MSLASLVQGAGTTTNLKTLIQQRLKSSSPILPLTETSFLRASGFAEICPREEVLCSIKKVERTKKVDSDLELIFEHGKGIHARLQNSILPKLGVLLGCWVCLMCRNKIGEKQEGVPVEKWAVKRPNSCPKCGADAEEFLYEEQHFESPEFHIGGHPDGFLLLPGMSGLGIIEAKSIGAGGAWQIKNTPKLDHAIQAHIYMWLCNLSWAKILYWDKSGNGVSALTEHTLEKDEETIDTIKKTVVEIWDGLKTGALPARICATAEAPRACACLVASPCFATDK